MAEQADSVSSETVAVQIYEVSTEQTDKLSSGTVATSEQVKTCRQSLMFEYCADLRTSEEVQHTAV